MFKAFIFDFFDVIHQDHQKAWLRDRGYKREGGFAEASDALDRGKIDFDTYLQLYAELSSQTSEDVRQQFKALSKVDVQVVELIHNLRSSYRTGLVSNAHADELNPILDEHQLHSLFDEIIISSEVGMAKPDPEIFQLMLKRLGVTAQETIFIDDNPHNATGAANLGITAICYTDVASLINELHKLAIILPDGGAQPPSTY